MKTYMVEASGCPARTVTAAGYTLYKEAGLTTVKFFARYEEPEEDRVLADCVLTVVSTTVLVNKIEDQANPEVGICFSRDLVNNFRPNPDQRWGQSFYEYMKLDRCHQDREFCDRIYNAQDEEAKALVHSRLFM